MFRRGMFRKNEEACEQWSTQNVELCADRQDEILDCAASMLAGGGRLVYSTCTFAPAEDEGSIGRFLERHPEFYVEEVPLAEGMSHGLGELSATIRLWPHKLRGEGHYVAVLRKEGTLADGGSGLLKNGYENGITAGDSKSAAAGIPEYLAFAGGDFRRGRIGEVCRAGVPLSEIRRAALPDPGGHAVGKKVLRCCARDCIWERRRKADLNLHTHLRSHFMRRMFYIRWIFLRMGGRSADT